MRLMVTIFVLLALQNVGSAQLIRPAHERLPGEKKLTAKVPVDLAENASLKFNSLSVVFDGGSYGAVFQRDDGKDLVIYFLHPGYWTKQAIKNKTQPIVVDLSNQNEDDVHLEVEQNSPFEKRLIELLNNDLANEEHGREEIRTLTRVRNCIRDRNPLRELRKRFPDAFNDE